MILFTVPKPFEGEFAAIQKNAIESWLQIKPTPTIILLGNEHGVKDIAKKYGLVHISVIKVSEKGVPLLNSVFNEVLERYADTTYLYVNSDIIILDSPTHIITMLSKQFSEFLAIGQRYEMRMGGKSTHEIRQLVKDGVLRLKNRSWMDYFLFTPHVFSSIPPFLLGRTFWDKWLVWDALQKKIPVIDITKDLLTVHQSHSYSFSKTTSKSAVWAGEDALRNITLAGGWSHCADSGNATHTLIDGNLIKQETKDTLLSPRRIMDTTPILWPLFLRFRLLYQKITSIMQQK
ncbi:MAG: hypothetical protein WAV30_04600 [Microgenomates group bacterium]